MDFFKHNINTQNTQNTQSIQNTFKRGDFIVVKNNPEYKGYQGEIKEIYENKAYVMLEALPYKRFYFALNHLQMKN